MKPLLARKYNAVIELWEALNVPDGFGGTTIEEKIVGNLYARREQPRSVNYDVNGLVFDKADIAFIIRKREINTKVNFIVYSGFKYTILNFEPTQLETQIKINCVSTNIEVIPEPSI